MPIVPSRAGRVHELVRRLASGRAADRDSAVAQLTLLGPRVIQTLVASLPEAPVPARLAAVELLERLADPGALDALNALAGDASQRVALRSIEAIAESSDARSVPGLARLLAPGTPARRRGAAARALAGLHGRGVVEALAPLVDTVLDEQAEAGLRLSILEEIARLDPPLPRSTLRPLGRRLAASLVSEVAARGSDLARSRPPSDPLERLLNARLAAGEIDQIIDGLRSDPALPLGRIHEGLESARDPRVVRALARVLADVGTAASIPVLSRSLARLGAHSDPERDQSPLAARAALHVALARLDSRMALHDLRDLVALRPTPVLPEVLEAAAAVGDTTLVPALARVATEDPSQMPACAAAYAAIARRHRLRRSSAALRRVRPEHRAALDAFLESKPARR
jgi:hypothetical protein